MAKVPGLTEGQNEEIRQALAGEFSKENFCEKNIKGKKCIIENTYKEVIT